MILITSLLAVSTLQAAPLEVPFRKTDDALFVDVTVNGVKSSLMFDTGFGGSVILDSSMNVGKPTGKVGLRDFVGQFDAPTVPIKTLSIGSKKIQPHDLTVVQQPMAGMSSDYGAHVVGILGLDPFKGNVFEINFEKSKLIFHPSTRDITKLKPDGKKTFLSKMLPVGTDSIEMDVVLPNGKKLIMALDTGNSFYATTHRDSLERSGVWEAGKEAKFKGLAGVASGPVDVFYKKMQDTNIFGVPVKHSVWDVIERPSSDAEADGTIGYQFLKNFNVTIDMERRRVWLENFTGEFGNPTPASVGISGATDSKVKRVVIYRVAPDSPAATAGIKAGDHLLAVDGVDLLGNYSFRAIERMLEGDESSTVKLAVSRHGHLTRHDLKRAALVNE